MASLAHALRSFRSGALSGDELFAEVDRILEGDRANAKWLLETLDEENTKVPLPPDIHQAVRSRIEQAAGGSAGFVDPDLSRTRLATSLFVSPSQPPAAEPAGTDARAVVAAGAGVARMPEVERIKGTGDVLNGRFVLEECIGSGGMSTVYKALDRRKLEADDRNPYVAVKVLNVEFRAHPDSLIALQREAKKSQSLAHPNIVRVYDFDRDGSTVYMTMEYLSGKSLAQILRAPGFKGLAHEEAVRILESIAKALAFAHDNGIVHADFKPANVIMTETGQIKVIDFGIARAFQKPDDTDMEATRFDPGSLGALTPTYASPEMLEHREPDPRDDIYALACITYEMFTGRHPFGRMQATEARDAGLEPERRKTLTRRQWKVLKSALAFDRDKRTPSVRRFLQDIRSGGRPSRPVSLVAGSIAVLVLAGGAAAYYYVKPNLGLPPISGVLSETVEQASLQVHEPPPAAAAGQAEQEADADPPPVISAVAPESEPEPPEVERLAKAAEPQAVAPIVSRPPEVSLASVMPIIEKIPCAALHVAVEDGVVDVHGYVSRQLDVKRLEKDLAAVPGTRKVSFSLTQVAPDKCAIIELYAPYWTTNAKTEQRASIETRAKAGELAEGDPLVVDVTTPPYDSYVNVDYYSLDGGVVHMLPSPRAENNQAPGNYSATLGDLGQWIISEPFGDELVAVVFTPERLFDGLRDEHESGPEYLAAVRERLERIADASGKDKIIADFVVITTKPKPLLERLREKVRAER
jgi:serine/threonine protein kinase